MAKQTRPANVTVTVTVELTDAQMAKALAYCKQIKPDATDADVTADLHHAAYWGPGVREQIRLWEVAKVRQDANEARRAANDEFLADFPDEGDSSDPLPESTPETLPADETGEAEAEPK